jgi:hypothetical protein
MWSFFRQMNTIYINFHHFFVRIKSQIDFEGTTLPYSNTTLTGTIYSDCRWFHFDENRGNYLTVGV